MELQDYIRILRRRGWIIILLVLMTAVAAFAFSKLQTPVYKSSVDILIQPARTDFGLVQSAKLLLRSYVSWMNTEVRAQQVIEQLQLDRTPGDLRSDVSFASDESRLVIQITVEDPSGDVANDIARVWRDLFVQWRTEENSKLRKEDQIDALNLDEPVYGLSRPKWKINVLAGAILGALLGGVLVFLLEWVESGVVRRPEDIDRFLGAPVLGTIPAAKIDISRPYLLGSRMPSAPALPQPSQPMLAAPPPQPETAPPAEPPPAEPAVQPAAPTEETRPTTAAAEDEVGPIEPTILLSKGDDL